MNSVFLKRFCSLGQLSKASLLALVFSFIFSGCSKEVAPNELLTSANKSPVVEDREPEAKTGYEEKSDVTSQQYMVVAANQYASQAGFNILEKGGSAIDAAVAIQMMLTLVEPQSSGIGGGAFMLYFDEATKKLTSYDGRETAPSAVTPELFLKENGEPLRWIEAVVGGKSVGVPGVLAALYKAHQQHGTLPWHTLFDDTITLAEQGFVVSPRLAKLIQAEINPGLTKLPTINAYFFPNGKAIQAGDILKNQALANALKSIASEGITPFYEGWLAKRIVDTVQNSPVAPGQLSLADMKNYQAKALAPVCSNYKQYDICGPAAPSSGGITVIQILKMLERFSLNQQKANSLESVHLFTQSSRLAFADRARYIADPAFFNVPVSELLNDNYIAQRSSLISLEEDMGKAQAGNPILNVASTLADDVAYELPSTSHFSIVDGKGNAISMTSSIEMGFGSTLMVEGFILNNQLTDFSIRPTVDGLPVANRVEAGKRPRSSMAPMMVFNDDKTLKYVLGSPGGSRIINYVAQTLVAMIDWQLSPQQAVNLPHVTNRNKVTTLEKDTNITALESDLIDKGHKVSIRNLNSGLHVIEVNNKQFIGGADPRREGLVLGN